MMTERDEINIEYVLSMEVNDVADWMKDMDHEEVLYALSIIECAHWKLLDESVQNYDDCKYARKVLQNVLQ
jgi:hypothetical protein